jgi:hypothetical protein
VGARDRLRKYFEDHVGEIISTHTLAEVAGIREYARRVRELREQEGMRILTHHDRADLKAGEYLLETLERSPEIEKSVSPQLRAEILERNGYTCQFCGAGAGDPDPYHLGRKVRLHIDHIVPPGHGGTNDKANLRVLCSTCNQTKSNLQAPTENVLSVLARIRKLPQSDRRTIFERLKQSFDPSS